MQKDKKRDPKTVTVLDLDKVEKQHFGWVLDTKTSVGLVTIQSILQNRYGNKSLVELFMDCGMSRRSALLQARGVLAYKESQKAKLEKEATKAIADLANFHLQSDDPERAIELCTIALDIADDQFAYLVRADAYEEVGLDDLAQEDFSKFAQIGIDSLKTEMAN